MNRKLECLALRARARSGPGLSRLTQSLLFFRDHRPLLADPQWKPTPRDWYVAERQCLALRALEIAVLPVWELPVWLLRVPPVPPFLFVRGDARLLERPAIGIVGARKACPAAKKWAGQCAELAVRQGLMVVSGGARGIDTAAHMGALAAGGKTMAYLGVGADRVYPKTNATLFSRILAARGALVSEHPPRTTTHGYDHARRNRFIAAHAQQLFIAEAATDSGSLGTADWARRLGVPIWVPARAIGGARSGIEALLSAGNARVWSEPVLG